MNKKVLLIDPVECFKEDDYQRIRISTNYSGTSIGIRDPLGIEYISGYLLKKGFSTKIIVKSSMSDKELIKEIKTFNPKIIGFSVWSYMEKRVIELASKIKKIFPKIYIVLGGYHPSFKPDIVTFPSIDFAIIGEGEETMNELAEALCSEGEMKLHDIKGISFLDEAGHVIITNKRDRIDFKNHIWPDRPEHILKMSKITGLTYPNVNAQISPVQISYSRGCPNSCKFCPSGNLWNNMVKYRDASDVADEIIYLQDKFGTNYVYFSDLTFNNSAKKVHELCDEIIKRNIHISWSAMVKIDEKFEINKQMFNKMQKAGCRRLAFGVETFESKNTVKKWHSQEIIEQNLYYVNELGIITRAFLMMGFPYENEASYDNMLSNLKRLPIDNIRLAFVTPFPGTQLYEDYRHELSDDYSIFTGEVPLLKVVGFTTNELIEKRNKIVRDFYSSDEYLQRIIKKTILFPNLKNAYLYFLQNNLLSENIVDLNFINKYKNGVKNARVNTN